MRKTILILLSVLILSGCAPSAPEVTREDLIKDLEYLQTINYLESRQKTIDTCKQEVE